MRKYEAIKTEYLCYLMNRAQVEAEGDDGYLALCEMMQEKEYVPILEMDENRCGDCRFLRKDFEELYGEHWTEPVGDILDGLYGENGTMLEMLIVLAERMNYDLADSEYEACTGKWFKEMLANCGLIYDVNEKMADPDTKKIASAILDKVIFRKYDWDGEGGLFPLRWPASDRRYTELIIQMNDYIAENYDIC